ncbi:hypothetical protein [Lysobacter gummosus]|uniref:hypothetical protein n=1 Tax=Lysobacter gummosus TaxID=262324 RepID=UPI00363813EC
MLKETVARAFTARLRRKFAMPRTASISQWFELRIGRMMLGRYTGFQSPRLRHFPSTRKLRELHTKRLMRSRSFLSSQSIFVG